MPSIKGSSGGNWPVTANVPGNNLASRGQTTSTALNSVPGPPSPPDSFKNQPAVLAGVGAPKGSSSRPGSSAQAPEARLTKMQAELREALRGTSAEMLAYTISTIENLAGGVKVPFFGTIPRKDNCVTVDEFNRGYATLLEHLKNLDMAEGLTKLRGADGTWKMALDKEDQRNPAMIRDYYMRIAEVARRVSPIASQLASMNGDNMISPLDISKLEKLKLLDTP